MIEEILKDVPGAAWPGTCSEPPPETYAVYHDDIEVDGPDGINCLYTHDITVELYALTPDPATEAAVEAELNARGIRWTKQAQYWLSAAQRFQTIYEFTYIEKRSV